MKPGTDRRRSFPTAGTSCTASMGCRPEYFSARSTRSKAVRLLDADANAIYAPPGYVLFHAAGDALRAEVRRDVALRLAGEPVPGCRRTSRLDPVNGLSAFSVSDNGVLTYRKGGIRSVNFQLTWFNREGKPVESVGSAAPYRGLDLAPDGTRVGRSTGTTRSAATCGCSNGREARCRDSRSTRRRTIPPLSGRRDGTRVAYSSIRGGKWGLYQKPSNGSGAEERLLESDVRVAPDSWSRDGRSLVYETIGPETASDLMRASARIQNAGAAPATTKFNESRVRFRPMETGWRTQSNESGSSEIYVDAFPQGGAKLKVSTAGGNDPRWRGDSRELFYTLPSPNSLEDGCGESEGQRFVARSRFAGGAVRVSISRRDASCDMHQGLRGVRGRPAIPRLAAGCRGSGHNGRGGSELERRAIRSSQPDRSPTRRRRGIAASRSSASSSWRAVCGD